MREERMAILRMLEEGKITADEAETLLESLGDQADSGRRQRRATRTWTPPRPPRPPQPPRPPGHRSSFAAGWGDFAHDLGESIAGTIEESLGSFEHEFEFFAHEFDTSPSLIPVTPGTTLSIKSNSGALTLFGSDDPELKIAGGLRGQYKVRQEGDKIEVKARRAGAALTIHVPRAVERLIVKTHLGEVIGRNFTGDLKEAEIRTHTGNIGFEIKRLTQGKIWLKSHTGLIKLSLADQAACTIKAAAKHMGEIDSNLALDNVEQGMGYLSGILNGGGADVRVITHTGGIFLRSTPSAEPGPPSTPTASPSPDSADEPDEG